MNMDRNLRDDGSQTVDGPHDDGVIYAGRGQRSEVRNSRTNRPTNVILTNDTD